MYERVVLMKHYPQWEKTHRNLRALSTCQHDDFCTKQTEDKICVVAKLLQTPRLQLSEVVPINYSCILNVVDTVYIPLILE